MFDGTLGNYTGSEFKIELLEGAKSYHTKPFPIPKVHKETFKTEVNRLIKIPRRFGFIMRAYVDSDHAGNALTRRSRTGFLIFFNNSSTYWMSKKQYGIETSSFDSEFIALKSCCEYLRGLCYKIRTMGIPYDYPSNIYGDNKSVLVNSSKPFSILNKKSSSIAYHFVREGVSRD